MTLESQAGSVEDAAAAPRTSPLSARLSEADAQQLRIKRFYLAAATSAVAMALFFACYLAGLINVGVLLSASAMTLAFIFGFYFLFRSGLNKRFIDPTLLAPQAGSAILVTSYVMAYCAPARPLLMLLYFAALMFYAFRFVLRDYIFLSVYTVLCYAASAWAGRMVDPLRANPTLDWLQGFFLLVALPWTGWIAFYLSNLRRRIRTNEALYRAIWEISIDAVLIFDARGKVRFANPSAARLFGYTAPELVGMEIASLQPEDRREELRQEIANYFLSGVIGRNWRRFEDAILTRDGREVPVEAALAEMGGAGGTPGLFEAGDRRMVVFLRNISERRALETIKDDFISTVSHELRTPLTSVIGAVEALKAGVGGKLPEESKALVNMAGQSADRLHQLIDTILDLQKIESGGITFQPESVDAGELIRAAVRSEQCVALAGVRSLATAGLPAGVHVKADPRWVQKVLLHLIDNALKFSPSSSAVTLAAERREQVVRFTVRDEGSGVPPQFASRIFGKFAQADASNTRVKGGAGLGLSYCKAIVEGCGGRIGYLNNPERGATFWFELPQAR
jgi:PAS domain S-box-containing protein